jgi:hypothetical protein
VPKDPAVNIHKAAKEKTPATTVEYAVILAALILTVIATIYLLAAPDGTGIVPPKLSIT